MAPAASATSKDWKRNLLADVVVTDTEQTNNTSPGGDDLAGQLATAVLPIRAKAERSRDDGEANSVAQHDRVVGVLLCLVLGLLLLGGSAVADLLSGILDLLLTLLASGLGIGLDGLRLVVRGYGGDVWAVDVDKGGDRVLSVLDLGDRRCATTYLLVLELPWASCSDDLRLRIC